MNEELDCSSHYEKRGKIRLMETTLEIAAETQTLAEFMEHAERLIEQMRRTGKPIVLTVDGEPAVVVQDPESFRHLTDSREYHETVEALRPALADMEQLDRWIDSKDAFELIRARNRSLDENI